MSSLDTHAQIHKEPTREENILDLLIKNKPGLIKSSHSVGLPGISDHCAVVTELDIDPPYRRTKPRPVRQFKKANWEGMPVVSAPFLFGPFPVRHLTRSAP